MRMNVRDVTVVSDADQPVYVAPTAGGRPDVVVGTAPAHEVVQVRSSMTVSPAGIVATIAAIVLCLFGAINVARAGFDGAWREPVVSVAGYEGTAVLGLIVLAVGVILLIAGLSRDRGAILFVSIVTGIAGATLAFEPTVGGDLIAAERDFGIAVLILAVFVCFVAAVAPSVRRTSDRVERA
jgi:hypothetical protein